MKGLRNTMMRPLAFCCLLLSFLIFLGAKGTPLVPAKIQVEGPTSVADQCNIAAFVRAGDLRSQSLTEGEAFLVNNLTKVAHSECGIQRWSLVLRHRQRFALRYLNKDLQLPERPRYNYTWDTYRQTLQDQAFYGMFNQPAQSSSRDLYEKEREEYDRKLEAYAAAVRNGAQWTELVQEKVLWQTETDMGEMPDQRHDFQISDTIPFYVASPSLKNMPYEHHIRHYHYEGEEDLQHNVTHASQHELSYLARVTFLNGTVKDIRAGDASIASQGGEVTERGIKPSFVLLDSKAGTTGQLIPQTSYFPPAKVEKVRLQDLSISLSLGEVHPLRQNRTISLNGTFTEGVGNKYDITHARLVLQYRDHPLWALEQLEADQRKDLLKELAKSTDFESDSEHDYQPSLVYSSGGSAAQMSETASDRFAYLIKSGGRCMEERYASRPQKKLDSFTKILDEKFELKLNVSALSALAPMKTAFSELQARLVLNVIVKHKEQTLREKSAAALHHRQLKERLRGWPKANRWAWRRCGLDDADAENDEDEDESPSYFIRYDLGPISVSAKESPAFWRNENLNHGSMPLNCLARESPTSSPRFLRTKDEFESIQVLTKLACDSMDTHKPSAELSTSGNTADRKPESPFLLKDPTYERWTSCTPNEWDARDQTIGTGTCMHNTGTLWADHIYKEKHGSQSYSSTARSADGESNQFVINVA